MRKVKPGATPPFVCTLNHGTAAGVVEGSLWELKGALGWLRVTKASTYEADAELVERDATSATDDVTNEDAVSAFKLTQTLPETIQKGLKATCAFGGVALPWRAAAAAAGDSPAALWDQLGELESRKLKSKPFLKQASGAAPGPGEVALSFDAGSAQPAYEIRGPYSSVSGCLGGDESFLIARVDKPAHLAQRLRHLATFRQRLDQQLARAAATNPERKRRLHVCMYDFATGKPAERFKAGDLFGFSVELDKSVEQPMYIQMINLSCDTMEIQALDLSGEETTAPGGFLKPMLDGDDLNTKVTSDGKNIYAFEGGNISVDAGYALHNAGKPAAVCFVFVATAQRVNLDLLDMDPVDFGARGIPKIKVDKLKPAECDCITGCVWMAVE